MSGGSINNLLEVAYEYGHENTPEVKFLEQYPCLNGLETDIFADIIDAMPSTVQKDDTPEKPFPVFNCLQVVVFEGLKNVLPKPLQDAIRPYLCRE